jgi:hypothetical protein
MKLNFKINENKNTAYLLFGWEAIEARPNLDPFESCLRTNSETGQVYTSDVHLKHHARRGIKAAAELDYGKKDLEIFYEKKDENGRTRSLASRVGALNVETEEALISKCLDIPLFGITYAKPSEKTEKGKKLNIDNFQRMQSTNTIIRPTLFHEASILSLGKNNAFAQVNSESGEDKAASGSAVTDVLEYGFFLALFEINLPALRENIKGHAFSENVNDWVNLLASGLWRAYSTHRIPSITQRSQFANFLLAWSPENEENITPVTFRELVYNGSPITSLTKAKEVIHTTLDPFLTGWQYTKETEAGRLDPKNTLAKITTP